MAKPLTELSEDGVSRRVRAAVRTFDRYATGSGLRREIFDSFDFDAGRQWPSEDKAALLEQSRAPITFNYTSKFIDAVAGSEAANKMEWKYVIGDVNDGPAIEVLSKVVRAKTDEHEDVATSAAFRDMLVCGYGWTDTRIDYTNSLEGSICQEHVDPGMVGWSPASRQPNLRDARYVFRVREYTDEEVDELWPGATKKIARDDVLFGDVKDFTAALIDRGEYDFDEPDSDGGAGATKFRVVHYQEMSMKKVIVAINPANGKRETFAEDGFEEIRDQLGITAYASRLTRVWHSVYVCGGTVLGEVTEMPCRTLECITGKRDRNKKYYYGLLRIATDPQRWSNKLLSNIMHIMSSAGKGLFVEADAIAVNDWRNFERHLSNPAMIKRVEPGALSQGKIKVPDPVPMPPGLSELIQMAQAAVPNSIGVSAEFLGTAGRTQSGDVEHSRSSATVNILSEFFQSRRDHIIATGRVKLSLILQFMPDWVFIDLAGEPAAQLLPKLRAADFSQYKVKVDEAPATADQRQQVWRDLMQIAPVLIPMGLPGEFWAAVLQYSSLPSSLVAKLIESFSQPNPMAEQAAQIDLAQKQANVEETQTKAMLNMAKAQEAGTPDMTNVLSAQAQAQKSAMEAGFKEQEHGMKLAQLGATTQAHIIKALADVERDNAKPREP